MAAKKKKKKYTKRFPIAKAGGMLLGIHVGTQGRLWGAILAALRNDMVTTKRHIVDIQRHVKKEDILAGVGISLLGTEISKMNTKYGGLKANLPLGLKVRL